MESARIFFESYLRDKEAISKEQARLVLVPLYKKYFSEDFVKRMLDLFAVQHKQPDRFFSEEIIDDEVRIVAIEQFGRYRYHLRPSGGRWEIYKQESECFACRSSSLGAKRGCPVCGGSGWSFIM